MFKIYVLISFLFFCFFLLVHWVIGRIWGGIRDICRVFLEILPLQKSKEKETKT